MNRKFKEVIDDLCNHKINKGQALEEIIDIFNKSKTAGIEFVVEDIGCTTPSNHGYIKAEIRYGFQTIENKIKKGDRINVTIMPY